MARQAEVNDGSKQNLYGDVEGLDTWDSFPGPSMLKIAVD
jgi:hypothetical protein